MLHARQPGGPVAAAQNCATQWSLVGFGEGQKMYGVELYAAVRLAVVDERLSHNEAGRRFGIDRRTVEEDAELLAAAGLPPDEAGQAAQAGRVHRALSS